MQIVYLIILGIAHGQQRQALQQKRLYFSSEIKTFKNTFSIFILLGDACTRSALCEWHRWLQN